MNPAPTADAPGRIRTFDFFLRREAKAPARHNATTRKPALLSGITHFDGWPTLAGLDRRVREVYAGLVAA